jgi:SMODS-associating 2TM, beta-strand rich effector domain
MHPYSVDSGERFKITCVIVMIGLGLAYVVHVLQDAAGVAWPWWFDAPAAIGIATILYNIFDRWAWNLSLFRYFGIVATPNFSGDWIGQGSSSHDGHSTEFQATLYIRQRWTAMKITLETKTSRSESEIAAIKVNEGGKPELCHTYVNRPRSGAVDSMNIHSGTATMRIAESGSEIEGEYYAGRGRLTEGRLNFQRQPPAFVEVTSQI